MKTIKPYYSKILTILTLTLLLFACSKEMAADVFIDMSKGSLDGVVTKNLSNAEPFGRWTTGKEVVFTFEKKLPKNFNLIINTGDAFATNAEQIFKVAVGISQEDFIVHGKKKSTFSHEFRGIESDTITFIVPNPISPAETGLNQDVRKLGAIIQNMEIISLKE